MVCPIQLVQIQGNGKFKINKEALQTFQNIKTPIAIISIAGLYRTGKSFPLNRLLGLQDAFEIGPSINPCTKGL